MKNIINNTEDIKSNIIEMEKSKILDSENKLIKRNLLYLVVSTAITLINFFIIWPIAEKCNAFSEGIPMTLEGRRIVFIISAPILLAYTIYFWKNFKRLKYFNFLNYPLIILNVVMLVFPTIFSIVGNAFILLFFLLFLYMLVPFTFASPRFVLIFLILCLSPIIIYGLQLDIKSWKNIQNSKN